MQFATMPEPPNDRSGSVSPFVGSTPMLTPMLMNACTPIQTPMPSATSDANARPRRAACRPIAYVRKSSQTNKPMTQNDAGESQLLGGDGEQEIGVRFGEVEQLLDRRSQPDADPFAAAERDQRMRKLVALAERIGPRIEERDQALQAVRRGDQNGRKTDRQQQQEAEEEPPVETAEVQDAERDRDDHDERAEVGLEQQEAAHDDHHREERQEALDQRLPQRLLGMQERRLAHRVARGVQHDGELHELGGLQVDHGQRNPAARAVDRLADARDEHERQQ